MRTEQIEPTTCSDNFNLTSAYSVENGAEYFMMVYHPTGGNLWGMIDTNKSGFDIISRKSIITNYFEVFHIKATSTSISMRSDGTGDWRYYTSLYKYPS